MRTYLTFVGTCGLLLSVTFTLNRMELGALAVAIVAAASLIGAAVLKEPRTITTHESALIFELAKHKGDSLSVSELSEKMKQRAQDWELSSPELQAILIAAQQAELIHISEGSIKINK
ncbi:hypothetical protein QEH56_22245 [Pelagicoccus enzymogenes]|uniref:hypothetical protein n=1 Tax=Pelagicoccus enzymogenes TaxID=2773457 RepID=UPI00280FA13F|nr:hypothetical protein [Pelagicoccus enzymogenes]MDQ8200904.1 hypothetical protein [Pelagicoccus enzymogenes]